MSQDSEGGKQQTVAGKKSCERQKAETSKQMAEPLVPAYCLPSAVR